MSRSFQADDLFAHVVKFSPDGRVIVMGSSSGPIYVSALPLLKRVPDTYPAINKAFDVADQQLRFKLEGHTTYVRALSFSPNGKTLYSGSQDGTIRTWDMEKGTLIEATSMPSGGNRLSYLRSISITPLGGLVAAGWWDYTIRISDFSTGKLVHCISTAGVPEHLDFSPDGKMCAAALDSGVLLQVSALNTDKQPEIFVYRGHQLPNYVEVRYLRPVPFRLVQSSFQSMVDRTIVSTDGNWVISGSKAGAVHFTRPLAHSANFVMQGIRGLSLIPDTSHRDLLH